jgi:1-acyl-sn-glycerol-3-phosphate acyltransferase
MLTIRPVRSVLAAAYWIFAILIMPPLWVIALLIHALAWPFDRRRVALHLWGGIWGGLYVWLNPVWRCRYSGREHLPWRGAAVIVANHASLVDILVLYALLRPFKWVSKEENFKVPFVGWNMTLNGYVRLARGDRKSIRQMMERSLALLRQGAPLLIFPEGTRTLDGRLQAFKEGGFKLAMESRVPVIPVAVKGTYHALPKTGIVFRRMDCRVQVLPPLDPSRFASAAELRDAAREAIAAALGESPAGAAARADATSARSAP